MCITTKIFSLRFTNRFARPKAKAINTQFCRCLSLLDNNRRAKVPFSAYMTKVSLLFLFQKSLHGGRGARGARRVPGWLAGHCASGAGRPHAAADSPWRTFGTNEGRWHRRLTAWPCVSCGRLLFLARPAGWGGGIPHEASVQRCLPMRIPAYFLPDRKACARCVKIYIPCKFIYAQCRKICAQCKLRLHPVQEIRTLSNP